MLYSRLIPSVLLALVLGVAATARAERAYRYTDDRGSLHIVDSLEKVPTKYRDQVQMKKVNPIPLAGPVEPVEKEKDTKAAADAKAPEGDGKTAEADKNKKKEVTDREGHNEQYWKSEFTACNGRVDTLEARVAEIQKSIGAGYGAGEAARQLEETQKQLADARKNCEELRKKARKAGAPPGWIR